MTTETRLSTRSAGNFFQATRLRRLGGFLAVMAAIGIAAQFVPWINDNSVRNVISVSAATLAFLGFAIWLIRGCLQQGAVVLAICVGVAMFILPVSLVRIRGFSGAFLPDLEVRFFSRSKPPLASRPVAVPSEVDPEKRLATADFTQFLGTQRTGVVPQRAFKMPLAVAPAKLWQIPLGEGWSGFAVVGDRCVTQEQRGEVESVTCYRLEDGALLWIHETNNRHETTMGGIGPRATPTIQDGRVYTQGANGLVLCLDLYSGTELWRQDLLTLAGWSAEESIAAIAWGRSGSPLIVDSLCVLPFGAPSADFQGRQHDGIALEGRSLIALDVQSGEVRWTTGDDQISYASPILMTLAQQRQIVIVNEKSVSGHAVEDGKTLWTAPWRGSSNSGANCAAAMQVDETGFLLGKAYGRGSELVELRATDEGFQAETRWAKSSLLKTKLTHAVVQGGVTYALSDGMLECVDLDAARRLWAQPRGRRYGHGQLLLVEDTLVVQCETGEIALVAARTDRFEELTKFSALSSKTWNIPAVAGNLLLVRNDVEAICFELPPRSR